MYSSLTLQKWHKYTKKLNKNITLVSLSLTPYLSNNSTTKIFIKIENNKTLLAELLPEKIENKILLYNLKKETKFTLEIEGENDVDLLIKDN
ncbi:hypothetical protein TUBRATIS_29970 [Tubulinosema ratisbonensis]|uniref:Nucleoplasmin-like domain-containing protein n=1 Tax=Tubulinosema ratisbonensis TaxID=291195 RepID=A0A437AHI6_9MICR|nr:hypothetical protein TUBRATIS_29970 [Tubulinosema ratisbonensis]